MLGVDQRLDNEVDLTGTFIALVVDNMDPKALERVKIRIIGVHDMDNKNPNNAIWAEHCAPSRSNSGEIPDIGDFVYVQFLQNNPMSCIWLGWVRYVVG